MLYLILFFLYVVIWIIFLYQGINWLKYWQDTDKINEYFQNVDEKELVFKIWLIPYKKISMMLADWQLDIQKIATKIDYKLLKSELKNNTNTIIKSKPKNIIKNNTKNTKLKIKVNR